VGKIMRPVKPDEATTWRRTMVLALRRCRLAFQIAVLFLISRVGDWAVVRVHLPVPGNVLGMLMLLLLLAFGVVKESWIHEGAGLLTRHLAFFFIPIAVGLMEWGGLFRREGSWLLLALVVSALAVLTTVGILAQRLGSSARPKEGHSWAPRRSSASPSSVRSSSIG
jgi:holin-like protein